MIYKGLFMAALVWLLTPRESDMGSGQPIISPEFEQLEDLRCTIFKGLDRVSVDLKAHRKH
jgi:hypothetical protein